jgi:solute:Na+ symporter, SSS family
MTFGIADIAVFLLFVTLVVTIGLWRSRHAADSGEDYFLAGRGLTWWLIGVSLIAANISTEQFVGMSGNAASHVGLAIASYEWMAAITLVVVAFAFLPYFLRAGIFTMPQFLEIRFNSAARTLMAGATLFIYMLLLGAITYSGALTISTLAAMAGYPVSLLGASAAIGVVAVLYVAAGGLRAAVWADLIQGSALILGGLVITYFAFQALGNATEATRVVDVATGSVERLSLAEGTSSMERFLDLNRNRLNMFLPAADSILPWTALLLGLWIPNFYYWGLNQYITQRTLGSASLAEGQKGIVFAAFLKLIIPLGIVIPGIIAFNLYADGMAADAGPDNSVALVQYLNSHPETGFVEVRHQPDQAEIRGWEPGRYLIAVVPTEVERVRLAGMNPFVIPITRARYDLITPTPFSVYRSADLAFAQVNPGLAAEIEGYNAVTARLALEAGHRTAPVHLIAYKYDTAMARLLGSALPQGVGVVGFILAALMGAVISSLAAMLNAASTIFTIDVFQRYVRPGASQRQLVRTGRIAVFAFGAIAIFLAPQLGNPAVSNSIFTLIQEGQGFISPGILAVFAFGLLSRRAPRASGVAGLLTNIIAYGTLALFVPQLQFLNRMAICFGLCIAVMGVMTLVRPLAEPVVFKARTAMDLTQSRGALAFGLVVVLITISLYVVFSPVGIAG